MKIFLYVCVHIKTIPWRFRILNLKNFWIICPWSFANFLKSRLIFNIYYFWMLTFHISHVRAHVSQSKRCFNVKSSTYYFPMKTKILADFQIFISVPFMSSLSTSAFKAIRSLSTGKLDTSNSFVKALYYFFSVWIYKGTLVQIWKSPYMSVFL